MVYEGKPVGTPDSAQFFRVIEEHKVVTVPPQTRTKDIEKYIKDHFQVAGMFTAPTAIRAIQREDPEARGAAKHDLSSLRQVP